MLIERYRHPVRGRAAAAACRAATADADGDDLGLSACAADHGAKISCETVLAVTALTPAQASPAFLLARNRAHWGIENGLHYRRDTTLAEDASRLRAGGSWRLFAAIANITVSVLNHAGHQNHAAARRDCAWDRTGLQALTCSACNPTRKETKPQHGTSQTMDRLLWPQPWPGPRGRSWWEFLVSGISRISL